MKTIKLLFAILLIAIFSGCNGYDDSKLQSEVDDLKSRVYTLEQLCKNMNENISSLQTIIIALQSNDFVTSVDDLPDNAGYTITFKSGKTISIYNGSDEVTPSVSVKQDTDGEYYWTINGEWLTINGKKVKAIGKDGITPKFKIENGYWYISYDEEKTWSKLGKAKGDDGNQFFSKVYVKDGYACFVLSDGTTLQLTIAGANAVRALRYIPEYSDGIVRLNYSQDVENNIYWGPITMDFEVFPASALNTILSNGEFLSVRAVTTEPVTKAARDITSLTVDNVSGTDGILSLEISPDQLKQFVGKDVGLSIAASFEEDGVSIISEYSELQLHDETIIIEYTTSDVDKQEFFYNYGYNYEHYGYITRSLSSQVTYKDGIYRTVISNPKLYTSPGLGYVDFGVNGSQSTSINFLTPVSVYTKLSFDLSYELSTIKGLHNVNISNITDMEGMFRYCQKLKSLDLSSFDTSNVTSMAGMFYNCWKLKSLDLSSFDTSNVTSMSEMFYCCSGLTSLDLSSFDTSNVTDMSRMFSNCRSLASLDLSSFDTSNVTSMSGMFESFSGLTSLDLSSFDTSNVTDMSCMFDAFSGLTSLDLSSFDTSNVTDMSRMFSNCSSLTSLDLSSFDTSHVTNMAQMFAFCNSLKSLDLSNWDLRNVQSYDSVFSDCSNLKAIKMYGCNAATVVIISLIKPESATILY